ncbi:carotenoid biosynthesis protein [Nocardioides rubriscoriae]|uniref:carotenoid biosynthesis protein n=1 Tax=Nocardioides rubriscoriae TaxID=642762 RepID=UPI001B87A908|nr:carotenoid biosynthesis protein [Nocardioides rubriscoriae]
MSATRSAPTAAPTRVDAGRSWPRAVVVALAAAAVLVQMAFPFTDGGTLAMTAASVLLLAGAAIGHALVTHGVRAAAALVLVAGGGGLLVEVVGVRTGVPFGAYSYAGTLGPQVAGVPVLVPLAWVMMTWPALHVGRLLGGGHRVRTAVVGAWALVSWDVFLDPQMVDDGHWTWADPHPALPGVEGIPLTNFAGWLLVSLLLCAVLDRVVGRARPVPVGLARLPLAVYLWTYASSVLAHAAFFGRPSVAVVGSVVMGVVAVPVALRRALRPAPRSGRRP